MLSKHLRNGLIVLAGQLSVAISGLLMVRLLTEYLSPAEYGYLTLGLTFSLISNQLVFGPLGAGVTRFFSAANESNELTAYLNAVTALTKQAVTLIGGLTSIGLVLLFSLGWAQRAVLIGLAMTFSLISGVYAIANGIFLAKNSQLELSLFQSLDPIFRIAVAMLFIAIFGSFSEAALSGYILGTLLVVAWQYIRLRKIPSQSAKDVTVTKVKWQSSVLGYAVPYASWGGITALHLASDRWVLNSVHGSEVVGLYATLYQIGYLPTTMLVSVFSQVITPHLYKIAGDGSSRDKIEITSSIIDKFVTACLGMTIILAAIGYYLHQLIFGLFVSKLYASVSYLLPLMILAGGVFATGQISTLAIQSRSKVSSLISIKVTTSLLGIIFNIMLGATFGVTGVCFALILFSILYLGWVRLDVALYRRKS